MSDSPITRETLEYLANLARIELDPAEEDRLLADLQNILGYVSELQGVDTTGVVPMNGGTDLTNIFREDTGSMHTNRGHGVEQFPKSHKGFLEVPPVFKEL
jgi:aspartyl-tRNA(Asn)/glutamyl-tRNA(Gln) amidotransferase subunit C